MANFKISQLPTATTLTTADLLPVVQGGVTKQVTPDLLPVSTPAAAALAAKAPLASPAFTGTPTIGGAAVAKTSDITTAIAGLVNGASTALDTLAEIDAQLAADEGSAAALAVTVGQKSLSLPVNVMSANGTAVIGARNAVNASAGPVAVILPNPTAVGQHIIIERSDASAVAANAVTVTGTIRGTANTVVTLAAVGAANEGGHYIAESLTSWAIGGSIKPKAVLDTYYDAKGAATALVNDATAATSSVWSSRKTSDTITTAASTPVFRPIGGGVQPVTGTSPTATGTLAGGTGVKRVVPAVAIKSFIVKWGNFTVGGTEASTTATTLSAATTAAATTFTTAASIAANSRIVIDTGANTEILYTTGAPTGTGPYTITTTTAALFAHASGVAIAVDYGDITIQDAAVEYPSGTFTPIYFNGNQTAVMKAGGIVTCDEVALDIPAGSPFWIRTNMSWTAGAFVALGGAPIANGQTFGLYSSTPSDKTRLPGSVGGDTLGPTPIAVLGRVSPTVNSLVIVGDSIATGQGDYPDIFRGYTGIATDGVIPVQKICGPSNRAMYDAANITRWRKARLAPGNTCAYEAHGINDITAGGQTLAQLQASKLTIWSWLRAIPGIRNIYTGTLVPFTSSTDGWMTTGSQTISNATFETIRTGINDWIRDGAPVTSAANLTAVAVGTAGALRAGGTGHPLTGYIDIANAVEANAAGTLTQNGGRWYAPGTIRSVTDAAMTSGTKILTSATAAFTSADVGSVVAVNGAGTAGGIYVASISVVTNATTVTLAPASGANAATTVSGATAKIGGWTPDGTHPGTPAHTAMASALTTALPTLTA